VSGKYDAPGLLATNAATKRQCIHVRELRSLGIKIQANSHTDTCQRNPMVVEEEKLEKSAGPSG
jgi:hypothetical protein